MAIRGPKWLVIPALVTLAPDTPGVFELWDGDELLFVGSTRRRETLRTELARQLSAHAGETTHFSWEITFETEHHRRPRLNC